jgi:hypothetical protein
MKKIYPFLIVPFFIILLTLFVLYNRYSGNYEEEQINDYISRNIDILNENLDFEKRYALSLSLFISKDTEIGQALLEENQSRALGELARFLKEIKGAAGIDNVDIQVHTKKTKAFARSWDKGDYLGTDLSGFRKGLVKVKTTKEPFVSIELGKRLNIKAISPIFGDDQSFIGSIEAIMGFQNIKKRLHKFDIDIIGLLDKKFIDIAVDLKDHKKIGKYYVVEKTYPKEVYQILANHQDIFDKNKYYYRIQDRIVVLVPMKSVGIQDVGLIAVSMPANKKHLESYRPVDLKAQNDQYVFGNNKRKVTIR